MQRTQIYLTETEHQGLQHLASARQSSMSALIREAIDQYLAGAGQTDWQAQRLAACGLWADRSDTPDLDTLRGEDRFPDWRV